VDPTLREKKHRPMRIFADSNQAKRVTKVTFEIKPTRAIPKMAQ
jgi:hypothetical protein